MQDLLVTLIQSDIYWHKVDANLAAFEEKIWSAEKSDLIILPEMFNTGFSVEAKPLAERINGRTFKWLRQMAEQSGATITGSFLVSEGTQYFNRLFCMDPDGNYSFYDKRHLFRMTYEDRFFTPGKQSMVHEVKGWKINPLICYDLRFPVWSRNTYDQDKGTFLYDLLIYVANWPAARVGAWDVLLKARSIENMCYTIGLNRIGVDGAGIEYNGHSNVIDPKGTAYDNLREDGFIKRYVLSAEDLIAYRKKFPSHMDFDSFEIKV